MNTATLNPWKTGSIPQWKEQPERDAPTAVVRQLGTLECESNYLISQYLSTAEAPCMAQPATPTST